LQLRLAVEPDERGIGMTGIGMVTGHWVDPRIMYETIRDEILDQKRCQFQLLSLSVTVTALVLAYGTGAGAAPPVYLAPLVMNTLAIFILLDKAVSIQRKVGYLQLMEEHLAQYHWMWERQLDDFRKAVPERPTIPGDPARKHTYVTTVGCMLVILNAICVFLYLTGPGAWRWQIRNFPWLSFATGGVVLFVFLFGAIGFVVKRAHLIGGRHSGPQIRKTWQDVLRAWRIPAEGIQ
jgi:hypothetical protein